MKGRRGGRGRKGEEGGGAEESCQKSAKNQREKETAIDGANRCPLSSLLILSTWHVSFSCFQKVKRSNGMSAFFH